MTTPGNGSALKAARRQRGVILPIVLVVMMIVTTLVITHVRRGIVDERLAANWSSSISNLTATESLLRLCELRVLTVERHGWDTILPSGQFNQANTPAWKSVLAPNQYKTVPAASLPPGASSGICIIENATEELAPDVNFSGSNEQNRGQSGVEPNLRKYRFTAVLAFPDSTAFGGVTYRSQSEMRWMIQ
jgi:hypothetical protein